MADADRDQIGTLIGSAPAFIAAVETASRLAAVNRPVLVIGERGTGKELIASRLHYLSPRWEAPLIKVNCAALSENLLDSELFGHEAGAFTGAMKARAGRFALADGGTLFLDEIAAASDAVQEKLLRVIEYGTFEPLGAQRSVSVDVRVVAAANQNLPQMAAEGRFRADLLDRLSFAVVALPPLRERAEDIPLLAEHFAIRMARELGHAFFPGFTPAARDRLRGHDWPGNVRELKNAVERAVALNPEPEAPVSDIVLDPFSGHGRPGPEMAAADRPERCARSDLREDPADPYDFNAHMAAEESRLLRAALARNRGHQKDTARHLGLSYHQLRHYLRKHGLLPAQQAESA